MFSPIWGTLHKSLTLTWYLLLPLRGTPGLGKGISEQAGGSYFILT